MELIILTVILLLATIMLNKFIKKHFFILSIGITIVSALSYFSRSLDSFINAGFLGTAFLLVVMFHSAFKKGSIFYKRTLSVRKEYSIFGFIFLVPHVLMFLIGENQVLEWNGIISFVIMIPLFITSFIVIRKKMNPKMWRKLYLMSYVAYILMFAHMMMVSVNESRIVYLFIACMYMILKIKNNGFRRLDTVFKKAIVSILLIVTVGINIYAFMIINNYIDFKNNQYSNGIYYGEAAGYRGKKVKLNVEIKDNSIVDIEVINFGGTEPEEGVNFEKSVHEVKRRIINSQSLEVDIISGATKSTTGLKKAVNEAIKQALIKAENK